MEYELIHTYGLKVSNNVEYLFVWKEVRLDLGFRFRVNS